MTGDDLLKPSKDVMSVKEVCDILGICRKTFYKRIDIFPFPILKLENKILIPREAFMKFFKSLPSEKPNDKS